MNLIPNLGAPFRVYAPMTASAGPAHSTATTSAVEEGPVTSEPKGSPPRLPEGDPYLTRLVKLVPSEVVALYLAFKEVAATWLGIWATICLVLVIFVRTVGTYREGKHVQWSVVAISTVSYVLWLYATGGQILNFSLPKDTPGIISVSVGVWTFLIPYIYTGDLA